MGNFAPPPVGNQGPTEITIVETDSRKDRQAFVTETDLKPALKELQDKAEFLSQFTKRVKRQMRAANDGPTVNAQPSEPQLNRLNERAQEQTSTTQTEDSEGIGLRPMGGNPTMRTVAIGASSLAEYIPGVQVGAFTALNTDSFTYYTFFARMNEQVRNRWVSLVRSYVGSLSQQHLETLSRRERQSVIEIVLNAEGKFEAAIVQMSSGDQGLDRIPGESFEMAAPFLNPPRGLMESDGKIHLKYAFVLQFRPPSLGPAQN